MHVCPHCGQMARARRDKACPCCRKPVYLHDGEWLASPPGAVERLLVTYFYLKISLAARTKAEPPSIASKAGRAIIAQARTFLAKCDNDPILAKAVIDVAFERARRPPTGFTYLMGKWFTELKTEAARRIEIKQKLSQITDERANGPIVVAQLPFDLT